MLYIEKILALPKYVVIGCITVYQHTLSPDHGWFKSKYPQGYCRYQPTCSDYAKQAFGKYGFIKGVYLATWRVLRCNPWSKGGEDNP